MTSKRASVSPSPSSPWPFCGLLGVDEVLLLHLLDDLVDQFFDLVCVEGLVLFLGLLVEEFAGVESLADGFAEVLHGLLAVERLEAGHGVLEAGVEQEVGERLHEVFEAEGGGQVAVELGIAGALHVVSPCIHFRRLRRGLWLNMQGPSVK